MYVVSDCQKTSASELEEELINVGRSPQAQIRVKEAYRDEVEKWLYCESAAKETIAESMKNVFQLCGSCSLNLST